LLFVYWSPIPVLGGQQVRILQSVNAAQEYNNGWLDTGTCLGAGTDVHHLRAEDNSV